jgi:hypothetical protein
MPLSRATMLCMQMPLLKQSTKTKQEFDRTITATLVWDIISMAAVGIPVRYFSGRSSSSMRHCK